MDGIDSILTSVKKLLGIGEDYTQFDMDVVMHINSALSVLTQLGVGPSDGFLITDSTAVWTDFLEESKKLEMVKTYVYMKTRVVFDPPSSSAALEAMQRQIDEFEWRIRVEAEM